MGNVSYLLFIIYCIILYSTLQLLNCDTRLDKPPENMIWRYFRFSMLQICCIQIHTCPHVLYNPKILTPQ